MDFVIKIRIILFTFSFHLKICKKLLFTHGITVNFSFVIKEIKKDQIFDYINIYKIIYFMILDT